MLRGFVLLLGAGLVAGARVIALAGGGPAPALAPALLGVLILVGTIFEKSYKRNSPPEPGGEWERSAERFRDPASGEEIEVWTNRQTGERRYVGRRG